MMRITWLDEPLRPPLLVDRQEASIGRRDNHYVPDVDLTEDIRVSRRHARLWVAAGRVWVQDLNSGHGLLLNGQRVTGTQTVGPDDILGVGDTRLRVEWQAGGWVSHAAAETRHVVPAALTEETGAATRVVQWAPPGGEQIAGQLTAGDQGTLLWNRREHVSQQQLAALCELPLAFAREQQLPRLYATVLRRVIDALPGAERGALLIYDPPTGKLALRASVPEESPPLSRALIQRAAAERCGFIWRHSPEQAVTESIRSLDIQTGMYAPLLWQDQVLGVIGVDSPRRSVVFNQEDLRFLVSVAHHAAAAVANQLLRSDLEHHNLVLENLLTNFSPQLRSRLVAKARSGRLQPGGEKSQVTLLFSDIRGFTQLSATMEVTHVVEMLNEYFSALVDAIFQHDGVIDKFIGDAILAVFGSPEPDDQHQEKAVRAALAMQQAVRQVNASRKARGAVTCEMGIGVHTGEVLHGFIGARERLEYTVIGNTVNRASRFCAAAGPGEILVSPGVHEALYQRFPMEQVIIPSKHDTDLLAFRLKA